MPKRVRPREGLKALAEQLECVSGFRYSDTDQRAILSSFERKADSDDKDFLKAIGSGVFFYVGWANAESWHRMNPSEARRVFAQFSSIASNLVEEWPEIKAARTADRNRDRRLQRRRLALAKLLERIQADVDLREDFRSAAKALAEGESFWLVENQIAKAPETREDFDGLRRAAVEAERRAAREIRSAGNRADEPLHYLVCFLGNLYRQTAKQPTKPSYDSGTDQRNGPLLKFLDSCLRPLSIYKSPEQVYELYRRAGADWWHDPSQKRGWPSRLQRECAVEEKRRARRRERAEEAAQAQVRSEPIVAEGSFTCDCGLSDQSVTLPPPTLKGKGHFQHSCPRGVVHSLISWRLARECRELREIVAALLEEEQNRTSPESRAEQG